MDSESIVVSFSFILFTVLIFSIIIFLVFAINKTHVSIVTNNKDYPQQNYDKKVNN